MKKIGQILFLTVAVFFISPSHATTFAKLEKNPSLKTIRDLYIKASESESANKKLFKKLKTVNGDSNPTLAGYKAASMTLKAKFADKIKDKKEYFKEGAVLLESLIADYPNNIELRLIRLSIQENVPKLLNYHKNIKEDAQFIAKQLQHVRDRDQKEHIKAYVLQSDAFSSEEKAVISKL